MLTAACKKKKKCKWWQYFITWYTFLSVAAVMGSFWFFFGCVLFCMGCSPFLFSSPVIYSCVLITAHIHLTCFSLPLLLSFFSGWGTRLCAAGGDGGQGGYTDPAKRKRGSGPDSDAGQHGGHLRHQLVRSLSTTRLLHIHGCIIAILRQQHLRYRKRGRERERWRLFRVAARTHLDGQPWVKLMQRVLV